jgi:hypothetical protein
VLIGDFIREFGRRLFRGSHAQPHDYHERCVHVLAIPGINALLGTQSATRFSADPIRWYGYEKVRDDSFNMINVILTQSPFVETVDRFLMIECIDCRRKTRKEFFSVEILRESCANDPKILGSDVVTICRQGEGSPMPMV